jgi:hypothetical protein
MTRKIEIERFTVLSSTILIDERSDGVHLSYDRMASFLATYQDAEALNVARGLDAKIEALLALIA